jgi:hypothetical protein
MERSRSDLFGGESALPRSSLEKARQSQQSKTAQQEKYDRISPPNQKSEIENQKKRPQILLWPTLSELVPVTKRKPTVTYGNSR